VHTACDSVGTLVLIFNSWPCAVCCRSSQSRCVAARPPKKSVERRCGYAFSYDENCGRLVADSMQVFTSTESLDNQSAAAAIDTNSVWCSASDVDLETAPRSRRLEVLTE